MGMNKWPPLSSVLCQVPCSLNSSPSYATSSLILYYLSGLVLVCLYLVSLESCIHSFIHSFIHFEHLGSAPSCKLPIGIPNSSTANRHLLHVSKPYAVFVTTFSIRVLWK